MESRSKRHNFSVTMYFALKEQIANEKKMKKSCTNQTSESIGVGRPGVFQPDHHAGAGHNVTIGLARQANNTGYVK